MHCWYGCHGKHTTVTAVTTAPDDGITWFVWKVFTPDSWNKIWMKKASSLPADAEKKRWKLCYTLYYSHLFFFFKVMTEKCKNISLSRASFIPPHGNSVHLLWCCETRCEGAFFPVQPSEPSFSHKRRHQIIRTPPSPQPLITFNFSLKDIKWEFALLRFTAGLSAFLRDPHWASWSIWGR